jgi:hypothetical protein
MKIAQHWLEPSIIVPINENQTKPGLIFGIAFGTKIKFSRCLRTKIK